MHERAEQVLLNMRYVYNHGGLREETKDTYIFRAFTFKSVTVVAGTQQEFHPCLAMDKANERLTGICCNRSITERRLIMSTVANWSGVAHQAECTDNNRKGPILLLLPSRLESP